MLQRQSHWNNEDYNDDLTQLCSQMLELHRTTSHFTTNGVQYKRFQLPILNAFALTVHKVQGLSLPSVTVALTKSMFADGQGYVGLSRATTSEQLFITQLDFNAIRADPDAIAEYRRLEEKAARLDI
jgi:ATP-dependent exoDNAse (exonuclease V) alpha subunit